MTASTVAHPTQNTAPVLEFRCLYTSDLRRKQKRWQDGRLKFHTFNKRVMVYDDRGNFVGDTHWREDYDFAEGEEVELERSGTLVQVTDCIGKRDQDLTELLDKRVKERWGRASARVAVSPKALARAVGFSQPTPPELLIRTLINGVPVAEPPSHRSTKRRKPNDSQPNKSGYARSLTGATLTLSGRTLSTKPRRYDPLWLRTIKGPIESIDLSDAGETQPPPQERRINEGTSQKQVGGRQVGDESKRSSQTRGASMYARQMTRAAVTLAGSVSTRRGLSPTTMIAQSSATLMGQKATIEIQEYPPKPRVLQDEFIDVDVYDREPSQREEVLRPSRVTNPESVRSRRSLILAPPTKTRPMGTDQDQCEQSFNPLRIRSRPKSKLLLLARPVSGSSSITEASERRLAGAVGAPVCQMGSGDLAHSQATERLDAFCQVQEQRLNARIRGNRQYHIDEGISSSLENGGMDYQTIDAHLCSKIVGRVKERRVQQLKKEIPAGDKSFYLGSKRTKGLFGAVEPERVILPDRRVPGPELGTKQEVMEERAKVLSFEGRATNQLVCQDPTDIPDNSLVKQSPPQLVKTFYKGVSNEEVMGILSTTEEDPNGNLRPPHQIVNSATVNNGLEPAAQQSDITIVLPIVAIGKPLRAVSQVKVPPHGGRAYSDFGPWSSEAFDLFDWKPGATASADNFVAG